MNRSFLKESLLLFLLALLLFGMGSGQSSLWDIDEPNNAQALKEMFARHDFIVPTFNGELRPDKPILNYWVMGGMTRILGFNEWGLRAGAVLFGALLVLLIAWQTRRLFDARTALIAGILAATTLHSQVIFRAAVPDPLLIFFISLALLSWINGYLHADTRRRDYLISYAALGLAVLTKGPIGLLLPGLIIVLYLAWRRDLPHLWRQTNLALGIPVFLVIALPWYGLVWWQTEGQWISQFLGTHNISRFSNPMEGHRGPFYYYLLTLPLALLPWSILLPQAVATPFRRHGLRMQQTAPVEAFLLLWAVVWIAFFSLAATKLPNYIWPAYPPLFILIAWRMTQAFRGEQPFQRIGLVLSFAALLLTGVALAIAGTAYLPKSLSKLSGLWLLGLPFALAGFFGILLIWRQRTAAALAGTTLSGVALTFVLVAYALPQLEAMKPSRSFGQVIQGLQHGRPYTLATWRWFQPSFLFYGGQGTQQVQKLQDAGQMKQLLGQGKPVYLALPASELRNLSAVLGPDARAFLLLQQEELYSGKDLALVQIIPTALINGTGPSR